MFPLIRKKVGFKYEEKGCSSFDYYDTDTFQISDLICFDDLDHFEEILVIF